MFEININPTIFTLGPFEIRYYGLIYVISFIIAYFMISYLAKKRKLKITKEDVADLLFYILIGLIVGARIFYIIFYGLKFYLANPLEMLALWHGGLSFHGGLVGILIAGWIFCRKKKIKFYDIADIIVIPAAIGLGLGRIGNFINGEVYGRITDLPWAVKFQNVEGYRHPSQFYESAKNFFIFGVLWILKDRKIPRGFIFWSFISMYGVIRFFIEFVKEPDGMFLGLTTGQWLCIPMALIGTGMLIYLKRKDLNKKKSSR